MKRPAFQFYPADWRKDPALQSCSIAARGLWLECMNLMHEADPYGHLVVNGKPMNAAQIGRLVGVPPRECAALLQELIDAGVPSVTENGITYSRRMVRDEDIRNRRANGGKEGSEHGIKGAAHGAKGGRPRAETGDTKPPLEPPPSSSTSSSASSSQEEAQIPSPSPTKNKKLNSHQSTGNGTGTGTPSVTIEDPNERMARFAASVATHLGRDGWTLVTAAQDSASPEHKRSLALCKQAAKAIGKGWPHAWPIT